MIIATVGRASALVVPLRVDKSTKVTAAPRSRTAKAAQAVAKEAVVDVVQFLRVRLSMAARATGETYVVAVLCVCHGVACQRYTDI